jgi:ABC-type methionine transport system ATPase subunit
MADSILEIREMVMPGYSEAAPFTWKVSAGETWLLMGEHNSGKSTLIHLILGLISPWAGSVTLFGETLSTLNQKKLFKVRQRTSALLEQDGLVNSWSVYDNIVLPLRYKGEITAANKRIDQFVSDYQFPRDWLSASVTALSYEERRMVALVRSLITRPELLVVDGLTQDTLSGTTWRGALDILKQSIEYGCSLIIVPRVEERGLLEGLPVRVARLAAGRLINQQERGDTVGKIDGENAQEGAE